VEPGEFAKSGTEHGEQVALFAWAAGEVASGRVPELRWMFAVPNGGSRGSDKRSAMIAGANMKSEGVKPGVADVFLPVARHGLHGLFIEMKKRDGGDGGSKVQREFGEAMRDAGYGWAICAGWIAAREVISQWLA
jgi:hypothetical protein